MTLSTLCIIYSCGNLIYHLVYQEISSLAFVLKNCFDLRELHFYLFIFFAYYELPFFLTICCERTTDTCSKTVRLLNMCEVILGTKQMTSNSID